MQYRRIDLSSAKPRPSVGSTVWVFGMGTSGMHSMYSTAQYGYIEKWNGSQYVEKLHKREHNL